MKRYKALGVWLLLLVPQGLLWAWIIETVPRVRVFHCRPQFSVDKPNNRISLQYRFSGSSWGWGFAPRMPEETMSIDLTSCELQRVTSVPESQPTWRTTRAGPRVLTFLPDGIVRLTENDVASSEVRSEIEMAFPGSNGTLVGFRFIVGVDDDWMHVWDAERPQDGVRGYRSPLDSASQLLDVEGTDSFYVVQPIRIEVEAPATPPPQAPNSNKASAAEDPFRVFDDGDSPFPAASAAKRRLRDSGTSNLHLFRIDPDKGPQKLASWIILSEGDGRRVTAERAATQVDRSIVTIDAEDRRFEFHSAENGSKLKDVPFPDDFDPQTSRWSLEHGRVRFGSSHRGSLFDFSRKDWFGPGKSFRHLQQYAGTNISLFVDTSTREYVFFDGDKDERLVSIPADRGLPLFYDEHTAVVCSTHNGFTVSLIDLASGNVSQHCAPLSWLPTVILFAVATFIGWSAGWVYFSIRAKAPAWLDLIVIGAATAVLLLLRCHAVLYDEAVNSTDGLLGQHYLQGLGTATIIVAGFLPGAGKRYIHRLIALLIVLAGLVTVLGQLHVNANVNWPETDGSRFIYQQDFYGTWGALTCIFTVAVVVFAVFLVTHCFGFRLHVNPLERHPAARQLAGAHATNNRFRCSTQDLLTLTAASAWMLLAWKPAWIHAREELQGLYDNGFFHEVWKPLLVASTATAILAFMVLSNSRKLALLASTTAACLLALLIWEPLTRFVEHGLDANLPFDGEQHRFAMATVFATTVACLLLRFHGWRFARNHPSAPVGIE